MIKQNYLKVVRNFNQKNYTNTSIGFNFFETISDTYYRENFHSDILQSLLNIKEFYRIFIEHIIEDKTTLAHFNYNEVIIEREKGRIDVSIISVKYKKAIIIENKINNANDTFRQLPKYIEYFENRKFEIPLVIYLSIDGIKNPSKNDWTFEEKIKIEQIFKSMSAMKLSDKLSLEEILQATSNVISNIDHIVFMRQYLNLLKQLTKDKTSYTIMEKFYNEIKTKDELNELITLKKLINDLPKFRATRLKSIFENNYEPFDEVLIWKETTTYFNNLQINECNFALDIDCYEDYYDVSLFDRNCENNSTVLYLIKNKNIEMLERQNSNRLYKIFSFPEEEDALENFIFDLKNKLKD